jgi:beta-glucosidase
MLREVDFDALEPLNLLDEHILETGAAGCSPAVLPARLHNNAEDESFNTTSAFIITSRVFLKGMRESMFNDGCDCGFGRTPEERLSRLRDLLDELRYLLDGLPPHLRQWGPGDTYHSSDKRFYNSVNDGGIDQEPFGEVHLVHAQNEVTRVNLHITHLWLQNFLLDRMDGVIQEMDSSRLQPSTAMSHLKINWREREDICRQLLHILHSIPHPYLEPNGLFLVSRASSISSYLELIAHQDIQSP